MNQIETIDSVRSRGIKKREKGQILYIFWWLEEFEDKIKQWVTEKKKEKTKNYVK